MKVEEIAAEPQYVITLSRKEAMVFVGVSGACGGGPDGIYFDPQLSANPLVVDPEQSREIIRDLGHQLEDLGVRYDYR